MDPCGDQSNKNKRKEPADAKVRIPFQVFWHQDNPYAKFSLKVAKPCKPEWDKKALQKRDYPSVIRERVSAENIHGLYIMLNLNHRNVMPMKAVGRTNQQEGDELSGFVEEYVGTLDIAAFWNVVADSFGHIPSQTFQKIVREVIDGVDYLWRNGTYHGNLSWDKTLYSHSYTVKLFNFRSNGLPFEQAQWRDLDNIIMMLEDVTNEAVQRNQDPQTKPKKFCGEINALVGVLRALDRGSPPVMRDILEDVFFWTAGRRARFIMTDLYEVLYDDDFIREVNKSDICSLPWNAAGPQTHLDRKFEVLLKHCNDYRGRLTPPVPALKVNEKIGCVQLVYAAYTHQNQIKKIVQASVDYVVCGKFPKLFMELNRIIKAIKNSRAQRGHRRLLPDVGASKAMDTGK